MSSSFISIVGVQSDDVRSPLWTTWPALFFEVSGEEAATHRGDVQTTHKEVSTDASVHTQDEIGGAAT